MQTLDLLKECAAQAGYEVVGSDSQTVKNKARALRRLNAVKADIVSRFGGKWDSNYREGWLPLVALYNTGTADFTNASRTIIGTGTAWTTAMKGRKILGPDSAYYRISSVVSATSLIISQPYQGTTALANTYQIWKDEYVLYPEVMTLGGFVDYVSPKITSEAWPHNMKESYPRSTTVDAVTTHVVIGRQTLGTTYSLGTVTGTANSNILTGLGTAWLANVEPGCQITIGLYTYHVKAVNSDTEIELYQMLSVALTIATTYAVVGKNAIIVRFQKPTSAQVVNYWYWAKDYPFVNDSDEDWVAEMYPKVILGGVTYYDYMDKNDPIRVDRSKMAFEDDIKNMRVAVDAAFTGVRTVGYYIPPSARE